MGQLFHNVYRRFWHSLWVIFWVAACSSGARAENNSPAHSRQPQDQPLLLVCVQYEFAIQIKSLPAETCHWIVLPGMDEFPTSVWSQFFSDKDFLQEPGHRVRVALLESPRTKKWRTDLLPLPALMFLQFQMPEDGSQSFLAENQTPLNWRFRMQTGMTAPYFSGSYIDKPFSRVGLRFSLDY